MNDSVSPVIKYRSDYRPSDFLIDEVHLTFQLFDDHTLVFSRLLLRRNPAGDPKAGELTLDGEQLELLEIAVNGEALSEQDYQLTEEGLLLHKVSDRFELSTLCRIYPHQNKSLEGLYVSNNKFCTQCEAEGFRKITFYLDRPDVLARYFVRIEADKTGYPYLLSNGNPQKRGDLEQGRHFCEWEDPFPKPSYLFALVAGDLDLLEDVFVTRSGRQVKLQLFVDKGKLDQSQFAMTSLKNAMKWDEQRYGLEYDLELYMIVAVGDFNMGAMENKGLNIFNTKYVLANPQTATDQDFENIESVIGHEYFHNWTGNRVTCRDWFQLSLKEGLTVFRDQQFTEDMRSRAVKRIDDVKIIRSHQFAEDAGPMAHPIRPESYIEMNNFYTVTVYNKGAEVIRMLHTLLGEQGFQKGMALYFKRHDGSAATCDDFVAAMADANEVDLEAFKAWYSQAGTPELSAHFDYLPEQQKLIIDFKQKATHPSAKNPFVIPVKLGLVGLNGKPEPFKLSANEDPVTESLVVIDKPQQKIVLEQVNEQAIPSLLRDFSAPVKLTANYRVEDFALLFARDTNAFNRWDAGQSLMSMYISGDGEQLLDYLTDGFLAILQDRSIDNAFKARALSLPDLKTMFEMHYEKGIEHLVERHRILRLSLASRLKQEWLKVYRKLHVEGDESISQSAAANRALKNLALNYLACSSREFDSLVHQQFEQAKLMTDELAAFVAAVHYRIENCEQIVEAFYAKWKHEALVMDKWLSVQATVDDPSTLDRILELQSNEVFTLDNPNKVRALFGSFAGLNFAQFHAINGQGYRLVTDTLLRLDSINPQVAASLAKQFTVAPKLDPTRRQLVVQQLTRILEKPDLSKDVFEVVTKTLEMLKGN